MNEADSSIEQILTNNSQLALEIENDPNFNLNSHRVDERSEDRIDDLIELDSELTGSLAKYNQFKVISDLFKEFNANFQYLELENCYYSLQNVHKKLKELNFSGEGIHFQQSVAAYIDTLHLKLAEKLNALLRCFWKITDDSLEFSGTMNIDDVPIEYETLVRICEENLFIDGHLDQTGWFISKICIQAYKEQVIDILQLIHSADIKLLPVFKLIRSFAFNEKMALSVDHQTLKIQKKTVSASAEEKLRDYCTLITYISNNFCPWIKETVMSQFGSTIVSEVCRLIRRNAQLLSEQGTSSREVLSKINEELKVLSHNASWDYNSDELDKFLNDANICVILNFESMVQQRILDIRKLFSSDWKKLHKVPIKAISNEQHTTKSNLQKGCEQEEDDWGWNEEEEEEEEEDGWGNDLDIDVYTVTIEVSDFAVKGLEILKKYEERCNEFPPDTILTSREYKANLLQASFFAMSTAKAEKWTQLYRDVKYMCTVNASLTQLNELNGRFLENHIQTMKKMINNFVTSQLLEIRENERSPRWDVTLYSMLPYIKDNAITSLLELEDNDIILSLLEFIVHESLLNNILHWQVISERASENLFEFISLLLPALEVPRLNLIESYRHIREKLHIVRKILPSHLKDILKMFYDGDFFLFETEEIIQWIVLLFADTSTRRNCIEEIRNARTEAETH